MQSNVINMSNRNRCLDDIKPLNPHFHVKATNYETKSCINTTVCMLVTAVKCTTYKRVQRNIQHKYIPCTVNIKVLYLHAINYFHLL
jgi:hypothetical protein